MESKSHDDVSKKDQRKFFNRNGFLLIPGVLDAAECRELRKIIDDLDKAGKGRDRRKTSRHTVHKALFTKYPKECIRIFKKERVLSICKALISQCGSAHGARDSCYTTHVMHNNAYCVRPGQKGQAPNWHTDDAPLFMTTTGESLPSNVVVAPMVLTCMYYLNDVRGPVDGMTHVIPESHRFGRFCTGAEAEQLEFLAPSVRAGTALIISSSLWHRGAGVHKDGNPRYTFQVSYARRLVGHKHGTIMDFVMPAKVKRLLQTDEDRQLLGYLQGGAYS